MSSASLYLLYTAYKSCMSPSCHSFHNWEDIQDVHSSSFYRLCLSSRLGNHLSRHHSSVRRRPR